MVEDTLSFSGWGGEGERRAIIASRSSSAAHVKAVFLPEVSRIAREAVTGISLSNAGYLPGV